MFKEEYTYGQSLATSPTKKIVLIIYFENLIVGLHVLYVFNTYDKFCVNQMLFTIRSINLFFMYNLTCENFNFAHFIYNIVIDFWSFENFANTENIERKCKLIMNLKKFTSNKIY